MTTFRKRVKMASFEKFCNFLIPLMLNDNVFIFLVTGNSTGSSDIDLTEVWQVRMREVIYSCWEMVIISQPQLSPPPPPLGARTFSPRKVKISKVVRAAIWQLYCVCRMKWQLWAAVSVLLGLIGMGDIHAVYVIEGRAPLGTTRPNREKSPRSRGGDIKETNCLEW